MPAKSPARSEDGIDAEEEDGVETEEEIKDLSRSGMKIETRHPQPV